MTINTLEIAVGKSRTSTHWQNELTNWTAFSKRLQNPIRTKETIAEFFAMSKEQQAAIKDVGGYVGGTLAGGRRKKEAVQSRSIICLDVDYCTDMQALIMNIQVMLGGRVIVHSTHKHTPKAPRLRILVPASRTLTPEEYEPVARFVASCCGKMEIFDDTTYEIARLMYWPTVAKDGEYFFWESDDPNPIDVDKVLAGIGDWRNPTTWPHSNRETSKLAPHRAGAKQADPLEKPGVIGAFCRAHTITEAINKYLPEVYEPTADPNRWTYTEGHTVGGLVVYDDDRFCFSNHDTDPASRQLCNAFDLVRIHKYGQLDTQAGLKPENVEDPRLLPSYIKMINLAENDPQVARQLDRDKTIMLSEAFCELDDSEIAGAAGMLTDRNGKEVKLDRNRDGSLKQSLVNFCAILRHDKNLAAIKYNLLSGTVTIDNSNGEPDLPWERRTETWSDSDMAYLGEYVEKTWGIYVIGKLADALLVGANHRAFHPIKNYLESLIDKWDGVPRLDDLLTDYLGAEPSQYVREVTSKTLIAAVARVFNPGEKFDNMLTLSGPQGIGKSTFWAILGGPWYTDSVSVTDMRDKNFPEKLAGRWIVEISELSGMRKTEVEVVKAALSHQSDRYRPAYGHNAIDQPRQCVIVGTTNADEMLRDVTGNRRFWVVYVNGAGIKNVFKDLAGERDQIWAEAVARYLKDPKLYLTGEAAEQALAMQIKAVETDDRAGLVEHYLSVPLPANWDTMGLFDRRQHLAQINELDEAYKATLTPRQTVSNIEIFAECFGRDPSDMRAADSYQIAGIMQKIDGWEHLSVRKRIPLYGQQRLYVRGEE